MRYNWQRSKWPGFTYDLTAIYSLLDQFAQKAGCVRGWIEGLSPGVQQDAIIDFMVSESIKTSEIEGEFVSRKDVMSSVRRHLGLSSTPVLDPRATGLADLAISVRETFDDILTEEILFKWHQYLLTGPMYGQWRTHPEPMQVVSGRLDKPTVHFEGPPSGIVPAEMRQFILWFNQSRHDLSFGPVRAAIAHLYFESIHPFEDGNGRIGRAIAEKALAQGLGRPVLLSLSQEIEATKSRYYKEIEMAQRGLEVTSWVRYFVEVVLAAQISAEQKIEFTLKITQFFDRFASQLNPRQTKVVRRMLDEGPTGLEGGMSAKKYVALTKVSKATATRDLQYLVQIGVFRHCGGDGAGTRYEVGGRG